MIIDIIFVVAMLYGFYLGFTKGIIQTVFAVVAYIFGAMAAMKFAPATTKFLETATGDNSPLLFIGGIIISFVLVMMLIRLFAKGLEGILESININIINQVAGGILLSGVMILVYSLLLWFGDQARMIDLKTKKASITYEYIKEVPGQTRVLAVQVQPVFKDFWNHSLDVLDRIEDMSVERAETEADIYDIEDDEE